MHSDLPIQLKGVKKFGAFCSVFIVVVLNSVFIQGSDVLQSQEHGQISRENPHQRRLLRDSSCTLYRKCVTYGDREFHHNDSWACQLSPEDSDYFDVDFLDIVQPSSAVSAALANANSGESTLNIYGAIADTEHMEMYVPDDNVVEAALPGARHIVLGRNLVPPSKTGILKLLVIRVTDGNNLAPEPTADEMYKNIFDDSVSLKTQMKACSYGKLQIEPFTGETPTKQTIYNGIVNINVTGITSDELKFGNAAKRAATEILGNLNDPMFDLVMFCLPKGPRGIAWAYAKTKFSFYNNKWCGAVASTMHEVGHNIGLGHSGELFRGESGDGIGFMGTNPGQEDVRQCYNPQKSYQLGWYDDKTETINPLDGKGKRTFTLNGIADFKRKNKALVVLRLEQLTKTEDYYIGFNQAKGINKDTLEDVNKLVIIRKDKGGPKEYGQSTKIADLIPGERHVIRNFDGVGNVQVQFKGLKNGNAKIVVVDNDKVRPAKIADRNCKKITIEILTDDNPKHTSWYITNKFGKAVAFSQKYRTKKQRIVEEVCLHMNKKNEQKYKFTILDDKGNGMCCRRGQGSYKAYDEEGQMLFSGGQFSKSKTHTIKVPKNPHFSSMAPSMPPTRSCVDNPSFAFNGKNGKNCNWVAEKLTKNRCKKTGVLENCPATCDPLCSNAPSYPSSSPTDAPSSEPTEEPSQSHTPSQSPSSDGAKRVSHSPSRSPSIAPSNGNFTEVPLGDYSGNPSERASSSPSNSPPTGVPSESHNPSDIPSRSPSISTLSDVPSDGPSLYHSANPSEHPSSSPSSSPSNSPSSSPSNTPSTGVPSESPSTNHSDNPSEISSSSPSNTLSTRVPTEVPSESPSRSPSITTLSDMPSDGPSLNHSDNRSSSPSRRIPSEVPSETNSNNPSRDPSRSPSSTPSTRVPTESPLLNLSHNPSESPQSSPSATPSTVMPSERSSTKQSDNPSDRPSNALSTTSPSNAATQAPSMEMSYKPSKGPSRSPSFEPSAETTFSPTTFPTSSSNPSDEPTAEPTFSPTTFPTLSSKPSNVPTISHSPSFGPSSSAKPSNAPTISYSPSFGPSSSEYPSDLPTISRSPSFGPSSSPSSSPKPSNKLSISPTLSSKLFAQPSTPPIPTTSPSGKLASLLTSLPLADIPGIEFRRSSYRTSNARVSTLVPSVDPPQRRKRTTSTAEQSNSGSNESATIQRRRQPN